MQEVGGSNPPGPTLTKNGYVRTQRRNQNVLVNFPEDPAAACEKIFYKLDEDSKPDVKEVVVQAKSYDELSEKMEDIKELSPDTVVLNGTIRSFESIMDGL